MTSELTHLLACDKTNFRIGIPTQRGAPVAQWVKRWPTDLAVPSSIPARGEIFSTVDGVPLHTAFHYHPSIVLIWLKYCWKGRKITNHPSIQYKGNKQTKKGEFSATFCVFLGRYGFRK